MPVIDPEGLFDGERLSACSDRAKFMWPYLYCISNGYARLETNLRHIRQKCFANFQSPPSEEEIASSLREYSENFLVLPYESGGRPWVQFDTPPKYLPKHKSKKDTSSPSPTIEELEGFNLAYVEWKRSRAETFRNFQKVSPAFSKVGHGIGIGVGIGVGDGIGIGGGESTEQTKDEDTDMKAVKQIPLLCQAILKTKADLYPSTVAELHRLETTYKGSAVINAFKEWAENHIYDEIRNPVSAFLREADEILGGGSPAKVAASDPVASELVCELSYLSRGLIQFDNRQTALLFGHLQKYTPEEITAGFKEFLENLDKNDPKAVKFAAKTFAETAGQCAYFVRRSRQEAERQSTLLESEKQRLGALAAQERAIQKTVRPEEEVEETLGGGE